MIYVPRNAYQLKLCVFTWGGVYVSIRNNNKVLETGKTQVIVRRYDLTGRTFLSAFFVWLVVGPGLAGSLSEGKSVC